MNRRTYLLWPLLRRSLCLLGLSAGLAWPAHASTAIAEDIPSSTVVAQEAQAFLSRIKSGEIAALSDEDVIKAFKKLNPEVIAAYLELGIQNVNEYELWMDREERLGGVWPSQPFINYIKYRHQPRQVYVKWLRGGAKAGQEMLFDETKRKDAMYGHLGGLLNVMSIWTSLNGSQARANSNHKVTDLGMQSIVGIIATDRAQYAAEGRRPFPAQIEVAEVAGQRTVALTWIAPSTKHYAKKTKVYLELKQAMVRQIEAWNEAGEMLERITLEKIVPTTFTDADFDPANKAYSF